MKTCNYYLWSFSYFLILNQSFCILGSLTNKYSVNNYEKGLAYMDMVCENPTFTENARSLLSCANLCFKHQECDGFCFNEETTKCVGCPGRNNRVYRSGTGFTFYDTLLATTTTTSTTPIPITSTTSVPTTSTTTVPTTSTTSVPTTSTTPVPTTSTTTVPTTPKTCGLTTPVSQWVQTVTAFSSEYTRYKGWEPAQVIGAPDVYPKYGDLEGTWTPNIKDANQFIEVQFAEAVCITGVEIYETYFAGAVKAVKAKEGSSWITLWSTTAVQVLKYSRIFAPSLSTFGVLLSYGVIQMSETERVIFSVHIYNKRDAKVPYRSCLLAYSGQMAKAELMTSPTKDLRLDVEVSGNKDWVEIDAIRLLGNK